MTLPTFRSDGWLPEGHHQVEWDEIEERFGQGGSRATLTRKLLEFRDQLKAHKINGYLVLDGSYISAKPEPKDFDILLVAGPGCQAMKDNDPSLDGAQTSTRD